MFLNEKDSMLIILYHKKTVFKSKINFFLLDYQDKSTHQPLPRYSSQAFYYTGYFIKLIIVI